MKKRMQMILWIIFLIAFTGCGKKAGNEKTEIRLFAAASLEPALTEIIGEYESLHPEVRILLNADSSGKLCTQILEGYDCNLFVSAGELEMDKLQEAGLIEKDTRKDLLQNQVVLITYKGSHTSVTGFDMIALAKNMALADESVPVGRYTRKILWNLGMLTKEGLSVNELKKTLGNIDINECGNVSQVKEQVKEHNNEIGTVYYSDLYGLEDEIEVIACADESLSGKILYPMAVIVQKETDAKREAAGKEFWEYLQSDKSMAVFQKYMFQSCNGLGLND